MTFSRILIGVDGTAGGIDAVALARRLASPATELVAVSVAVLDVHHLEGIDPDRDRELREAAWARVADLGEPQGDLRVEVITAVSVAAGLHEAVQKFDAGLIVMGSSRRGRIGRILAGDAVKLTLREAPCPIAIAPHDYALADRPIVTVGVGWQGDEVGDRALAVAQAAAAGIGASVHALTVVGGLGLPLADGVSGIVGIDPDVALTGPGFAGRIQATIVTGEPGQELERYAAEVDLLVVGSHQRGVLGRLALGSTAEHLTRHCLRPMIVAPRTPVVASLAA